MKKEIRGILFLLIAIILGVSLFSYHHSDPIYGMKTAHLARTHNLFGPLGASLAGWIFFILGFSSFWLVAIFVALSLLSFAGHPLMTPAKSIIFIVCLVISFSGILDLHFPKEVLYRGGKVLGGGLVGHYIAGFMKGFLNHFGAYVLLSAVFVISFMICTNITLGWIFSRISVWVLALVRRFRENSVKRQERKRKKRVLEKALHQEKAKPRRKVVIVEPKPEPPKRPEQEAFPFMNVAGEFKLPSLDLLNRSPEDKGIQIQKESLEANARRLEMKLGDFGVEGEVVEILPGPVITMYEYRPAPGIKISKVAGLCDDLALALRAPSVRIVAPIPGKAAIGIEIPNNQRSTVYLEEILSSQAFKTSPHKLTIALGKDITGAPIIADLTRMPHLLVAGATGTGKSVSLNAMIISILFKASPEMVRLLMIDPKRIELSIYKDIPHLLHPVVTQPKEATKALRWAVAEMERRYILLSDRGVRNIEAFNRKILKDKRPAAADKTDPDNRVLPYIILVIDELADLMMTSSRDVEEAITRLAQMARAAGIHLIIATQRPSVDVLTGIIKANFPARISFQVSSRVDSRTILDNIGAENLLGEGDMLFLPPGVGRIMRIHGALISEEEIRRVTDFLRAQMTPDYDSSILSEVAEDDENRDDDIELDEKYDKAVDLVIQTGQASISMIQRRLRVGYNRAARMIEAMETQGIVGPSDGVRPREVFRRQE
ncbi:MAG: DNA translocase FtsK 4TM domain-containing protein [Desulfobacterales bacterium]|nr:DNA translocase FtsK 4TM domain-containing protein [Desulfobacterales bacterium]